MNTSEPAARRDNTNQGGVAAASQRPCRQLKLDRDIYDMSRTEIQICMSLCS